MSDAANTTERLANQIANTVAERARVYGAPEENFAAIGKFWRTWVYVRHGVEIPFDATDVGMMSALIKVARLAQTPGHEDSALDAATYLLLGHGCVPSGSLSVDPTSEVVGTVQHTEMTAQQFVDMFGMRAAIDAGIVVDNG